jgi:hypothetical protein
MSNEPLHPIQAMVDGMSAAWQRERSGTQWTLGKLIAALETLGDRLVEGIGKPHSYRGYYCDLAFDRMAEPRKASDILADARGCMGREFTGYKGGDFLMGESTPVWIAAYGHCGRKIVGVDVEQNPIALLTREDD